MRLAARAAPLLFPVILLFFATYFLFGQIGFWSDDYFYNLRDPVSGEITQPLIMSRNMFFRPFFYRTVPPMLTLLWDHGWVLHLIQVAAHGLFALLLFSFLRTLGAPVRPAAGAALVFMVYPVHFETVLWFSALPTLLACAAMVGLLFMTVWFTRGAGPFRKSGGWWSLPLMMAAAFIVCCFNEQPAAGIAAMPLVYACVLAGGRSQGGHAPPVYTRRMHVLRALVPAALCTLVVAAYTWMVIRNAPDFHRASLRNFVPLNQMWDRAIYFWDVVWRRMVMKNFATGAFRLGLAELKAAPAMAIAWGALLAGALVPFSLWWVGRGEPAGPKRNGVRSRRAFAGLLILAGLATFFIGFAPIMVFANHEPDSRMRYWPCVGLAMVVAALLSLGWNGEQCRTPVAPASLIERPRRIALLAALLPVFIAFSIIFIGVQSAFKLRWERDQFEAAELRRLIPDPEPLTFFLPMQFERWAVQTGSPVLDKHFRSAWEFPWSAPQFLRSSYRRDDVHCGDYRHWARNRPIVGANEDGIFYADRLGPRFATHLAGSRIAWERALPFTITADGQLRIVTRIIIEASEGHAELEVLIPQAQRLPEFTVRLPRA